MLNTEPQIVHSAAKRIPIVCILLKYHGVLQVNKTAKLLSTPIEQTKGSSKSDIQQR